MRKDILKMSQKERQRHNLLKMVLEGKNTLKDASKLIGVSYRHAKQLKKRFITEGAKGLVHGNRGRPSPMAVNHQLSERIIELS
jgi:transposase